MERRARARSLAVHDFGALRPDGTVRTVVSDTRPGAVTAEPPSMAAGSVLPADVDGSSTDLGTLVHALVSRAHRRGITDEIGLGLLAEHLVHPGDGTTVPPAMRTRAVSLVARLLARDELRPRADADVLFETPYSRRLEDGRIERGTIDCLVVEAASVLVLDETH